MSNSAHETAASESLDALESAARRGDAVLVERPKEGGLRSLKSTKRMRFPWPSNG